MNRSQKQQFEVLCETAELIIESYHQHRFLPDWLFTLLHSRASQVKYLKKTIEHLKNSQQPETQLEVVQNQLIKLLDHQRYYFSVHSVSKRFRSVIQDALLATLNFKPADVELYNQYVMVENNIPKYLNHFKKSEEVKVYREHFTQQHKAYGVDTKLLSELELDIFSKSNVINGKLIDKFGFQQLIKINMQRVRSELYDLVNRKIECGFLTLENALGYIHKIDLLFTASNHNTSEYSNDEIVQYQHYEGRGAEHLEDYQHFNYRFSEEALVQNARYILETITNAAGVLPLGPAKYPEHAVLITSCYWVDEILQQMRAKLEVA